MSIITEQNKNGQVSRKKEAENQSKKAKKALEIIDKISQNDSINDKYTHKVKLYTDGIIEPIGYKKLQERDKGVKPVKKGEGNPANKLKNRYRASYRAGSLIRSYIHENDLRYMWTLTYADEVTDRDKVWNDFKLFIKRLKYRTSLEVPYVAIQEVQKKREQKCGKPVLHIHFSTDKRIEHETIKDTWSHGHVYVSYFSGEKERVAGYMSKYVKKDMIERLEEEESKKSYTVSKGLRKPDTRKVILTDEEEELLKCQADISLDFGEISYMKLSIHNLIKLACLTP